MQPLDLLSVPGVLALVEVAKRLGVPGQYAPLVSVVLSVALSLLVSGVDVTHAVEGLMLGLSASGLYSGVRSVAGK